MLYLVAGTRPNFMKISPIYRELVKRGLPIRLMHTGQHFDETMSDVFFRDLGMPEPHARLHAGGGSHAEQTALVLVGVERDLIEHRPSMVVVVGDVTSTLAAALAASKLGIPIVHVEAGLRSGNWSMPEEINRVVTDQLANLLLTPSEDAAKNLLAEGIPDERIRFVGNVMIDSLHFAREKPTDVMSRHALRPRSYALATLHRPANVDTAEALAATLDALEAIAARIDVLLPLHPRTLARARVFDLADRMARMHGLRTIEPVGYNDFVTLLANTTLVATDSGGIQEESTALGIPCLTMREGTERPVTVTEGTNIIVGLDVNRIAAEVELVLTNKGKKGRVPAGWDGNAAGRIVDALEALSRGSPAPKTASRRS